MGEKIIQVSDIHLFADSRQELLGVNTRDSFQAVCDKILQDEKDAKLIVLSGDLSQDNSEASYRHLAEMVKPLRVPVYYIPGNHDDTKLMPQIFPLANVSNDKHVLLDDWQLILLNSQKSHAVEGLLDTSQFDFMQTCLKKYPDHHAIVIFHHHPFHVGSAWLDNLGLTNAEQFWQIAATYPNIRAVLFGHVHQQQSKTIGNIVCYSAPSTCFQFMRHQDQFGLENLTPGYRWLNLNTNGSIETDVSRVAQYIGKFDTNAKGY